MNIGSMHCPIRRFLTLVLLFSLFIGISPSPGSTGFSIPEEPCALLAASRRESNAETDRRVMALLNQPKWEAAALEWLVDRFDPIILTMALKFGFHGGRERDEVRSQTRITLWERRADYDPEQATPNTWVSRLAFYAASRILQKRNTILKFDGEEMTKAQSQTIPASSGVRHSYEDSASLEEVRLLEEFFRSQEEEAGREFSALQVVWAADADRLRWYLRGEQWRAIATRVTPLVEAYARLPLSIRALRLIRRGVPMADIARLLDIPETEVLYLSDSELIGSMMQTSRFREEPEIIVIPEEVLHHAVLPMKSPGREMATRLLLHRTPANELSTATGIVQTTLEKHRLTGTKHISRVLGLPSPARKQFLRIIPQALFNREFGTLAPPADAAPPPFFYLSLAEFNQLAAQLVSEDARLVARLYYEYRYSTTQIARIFGWADGDMPTWHLRRSMVVFSQQLKREIGHDFIAVHHELDEIFAATRSSDSLLLRLMKFRKARSGLDPSPLAVPNDPDTETENRLSHGAE